MKREHYGDYTVAETLRSESALLTVWAVLREFEEELALIGGLVPRYLCSPASNELQAVTMDVDIAVSLGLSSGLYDTTTTRLRGCGFSLREGRFVKEVGQATLFLDFLTDKPAVGAPDSVMVDDMPVAAVFGVARALEACRLVRVKGKDLYGADVIEEIKVCEAGPYVCLKLSAYHARAQSKDVFDVVRCVRDYDGGPAEAARLFRAEEGNNLAYPVARHILKERFWRESAKGPAQYVDFCLGGAAQPSADARFRQHQLRNEAVDVARLLLE